MLHWLVYKRSDYLISRGSRSRREHFKLIVLYNALMLIDFVVAYTFYDKFSLIGQKMNDIYVIIGFEVSTRVSSALLVRAALPEGGAGQPQVQRQPRGAVAARAVD